MCFGSDAPSAPQIGAPPSLAEIMDVIDEITGTQSLIVTGADGKKKRVNSRLPRTEAEQQRFSAAEKLVGSAIKHLKDLNIYKPESLISFAPLIETFASINTQRMDALGQIADLGNIKQDIADFKQMQSNLIDEQFATRNRTSEEGLSHSGRGSGTYAAESRAAMAREHALARQEGDIKANLYGEDIAAKRLGRNTGVFNLQEAGREGQLESAMGQYGIQKDHENDTEKRRLVAIEQNKAMLAAGSGVIQDDLNKALANNNSATSLATYGAENNAKMAHYNADVNRQNVNYQNQMTEYQNRAPSFGEIGMNLVGQGIGAYMTGGTSLAAQGASQFAGRGTNPIGTMRKVRGRNS